MIQSTPKETLCAGTAPGYGCEVFERYAQNETAYIAEVGIDDPADTRSDLLDAPEQLRVQLHYDFVQAGFCVLAVQREKQRAAGQNVVSIFRKQEAQNLQFAGCEIAHLTYR